MASAVGVRFVRCPKCGKLLTEFAQVPIYRCGGCSTLLRVKAHVSIGAIESIGNVSTDLASEAADGEEVRVAQPGHRRRRASSSNAAHGSNGKEEVAAEHGGNAHVIAENLSVSVDGDDDDDDDIVKSTSRISCRHNEALSTDDFRSVQNWMGSEIGGDHLMTLSEDLLLRARSNRSEPDPLEILRKVDELRDEIGGLLARSKEGRHADPLPEKPSHGRARKQPVVRRYYRPVRGGAPFVVCCRCWRLLQLPADFLVSTSGKTLHRLRCGACSEVLVFSFRPRALRSDPREAEHRSGSESYSSEPEPEPEPVHNVSRSSSYSAEKLHRLMGYSSASDVLFRSGGHVDGGYESSETSTPPRVERRRYGAGAGTSKSAEIQEVVEESHERAITPRRRRRGSA